MMGRAIGRAGYRTRTDHYSTVGSSGLPDHLRIFVVPGCPGTNYHRLLHHPHRLHLHLPLSQPFQLHHVVKIQALPPWSDGLVGGGNGRPAL
eukprot:1714876-Rhodomonas_salina.1